MEIDTRLNFKECGAFSREELEEIVEEIDQIISMTPIPYDSNADSRPIPLGKDAKPMQVCDRLIEIKTRGPKIREYEVLEYYNTNSGFGKNSAILSRELTQKMIADRTWDPSEYLAQKFGKELYKELLKEWALSRENEKRTSRAIRDELNRLAKIVSYRYYKI